jgi:hypothetical protein
MTHPLLIVIEETSQRRGKFSAHLLDGRKLLSSSRQPLLDAARVLPAQGIPPETPLAMQHKGSATIAMTSTVGEAAKLTVEEEPGGPRFRKWRPFPASRSVRTGDESDEGLVDSPQPLTVPQNAPVSQPAGAAHACRGSARTGDESDET